VPGIAVADASSSAGASKKSSGSEAAARVEASGSRASSNEASASAPVYVVRRGDTVNEIAKRHGVSVSSILKSNGLSSRSRIYPGQKLRVGKGTSVAAPKSKGGSSKSASITTYTVRAGDTLWRIAKRFGTPVGEILSLNGLRTDAVIRPGDRLKIGQR
jgi:LysM repeat protein